MHVRRTLLHAFLFSVTFAIRTCNCVSLKYDARVEKGMRREIREGKRNEQNVLNVRSAAGPARCSPSPLSIR
jgi:hypothetical protein